MLNPFGEVPKLISLPSGRGQDVHLIPVFRHRSAGDLDPLFLEHLRHILIAVRRLRIFFVHDLFDKLLDAVGGDPFSCASCHACGEEILDLKDAPAALHILAVDGAGYP